MEDWTRVVLYGTYDGFVCSTVDSLQIAVRLDGGERVEIPSECVISADQIVKRDEIKLKDVIKRIKYFDLVTQAVWVNGILNELGSGYGLHKYHEGYKQGKLDGAMEREKVQVPQFVADWIEEGRKHCKDVSDLFDFDFTNEEVGEWFLQEKPFDLVARAWLDGYTVEEKRYLVKMKGMVEGFMVLKLDKFRDGWYLGNDTEYSYTKAKHTRKELEEAGFGEVFNSPLFEVEEVE